MVKSVMRWIYLSPHLDDAVLSAGGLIYEQTRIGFPVEIWTMMCGSPPDPNETLSPYAQLLHSLWGASSAEDASQIRRAEDKRAAGILGADVVHFDFWDCIYRRGADGNWLYSDVFLPPHPADGSLPTQIAQALREHLRSDDVLVCQLALGSHVDHVLVRRGAEQLGRTLLYDIDVPYIFYHTDKLEQTLTGMQETRGLITETGLKRWQEASLEYKSQISTLREAFDTPEKVRLSLQAYWSEREGIRLLQID